LPVRHDAATVMTGLVPGIRPTAAHSATSSSFAGTLQLAEDGAAWMAVTSPAMTKPRFHTISAA
jgi:hypothetical protein